MLLMECNSVLVAGSRFFLIGGKRPGKEKEGVVN